jgi:hypothetical protein
MVSLACTGPPGTAGTPLAYAIDRVPARGALGAIDPVTGGVDYTSTPGLNGADSFTYQASGPGGTSAAVTAAISVPKHPGPQVLNDPRDDLLTEHSDHPAAGGLHGHRHRTRPRPMYPHRRGR